MHVYVYVGACVCVYMWVHVYVHVGACVCVYMWVHVYVYVYVGPVCIIITTLSGYMCVCHSVLGGGEHDIMCLYGIKTIHLAQCFQLMIDNGRSEEVKGWT